MGLRDGARYEILRKQAHDQHDAARKPYAGRVSLARFADMMSDGITAAGCVRRVDRAVSDIRGSLPTQQTPNAPALDAGETWQVLCNVIELVRRSCVWRAAASTVPMHGRLVPILPIPNDRPRREPGWSNAECD